MDIGIIGGGITGLTTAIALHKLGIPCKVYERAPQFTFTGAGIHLSPNAIKVFKWLGMEEEIVNAGVTLKNAVITNKDLKPLRKSKAAFISDDSHQFMVGIHRATLHQVLVKHIPENTLQLGYEFQSYDQLKDTIQLNFSHTSTQTGILLGCDGIHSRIRQQLFPEAELRYSGYTCWRGVSRAPVTPEFQEFSAEAWGWKKRFGFANIGHNLVYWFAVISAPPHFPVVRKDIHTYLKEQFHSFHPCIQNIIDQTDLQEIFRDDIEDVKPLNRWHHKNICLLGDAAHATTPNMGQGGAQGIEDAYYMSQCLKKFNNPIQAFENFESMRRKKVDQIVNNSWMMGKWAHSTFGQPLLKFMLGSMPEKSIAKQMQQVFHIDEPFAN
jgi:2-polyprenyl-6-methoxyphenol hydroxylase-like FAD-dependent oxidoreductase